MNLNAYRLRGTSRLILILGVLLLATSPAFALLTNKSISIYLDDKRTGVANEGDRILVECDSTLGTVTCDLTDLNLGVVSLTNTVATHYQYISAGLPNSNRYDTLFGSAVIFYENNVSGGASGNTITVNTYRALNNSTPNMTISVDSNGVSGTANYADTIKVTVQCTANTLNIAPNVPTLSIPDLGITNQSLAGVAPYYSTTVKVPRGTVNTSDLNAYVTDDINDPKACTKTPNPYPMDQSKPYAYGNQITVVGEPAARAYRGGETLDFYVEYPVTAPDTNSDLIVTANLSELGLGVSVPPNPLAGAAGTYGWRYRWTLPLSTPNIDQANANIIVYGAFPGGTPSSVSRVVKIDTALPILTNVNASINGGYTWARVGHVITITATITNPDDDLVEILASGTIIPTTLDITSNYVLSGGKRIYTKTITIPNDQTIYTTTGNFTIQVTDNTGTGNVVTAVTTPDIKIDTTNPAFNPLPDARIVKTLAPGDATLVIAGITDHIIASFSLLGPPYFTGGSATIDLSAIGGPSALAMSAGDGLVSFYTCNYAVTAAASAQYPTTFQFPIKCYDAAGNMVYDTTTPAIMVDNTRPVAPPMTVRWIQDVPTTGKINFGDGVTREKLEFIVNTTGADWGDFATLTQDLGVIAQNPAKTLYYDSLAERYYLATQTASTTYESAGYIFSARIVDKAGNLSSTNSVSGPFDIDCQAPSFAPGGPLIVSNSLATTTVGSLITITAPITNPDSGTCRVNLSQIGKSGTQQMYDDGTNGDVIPGDAEYTYAFTLASGTVDGATKTFQLTFTDNAGNSVSSYTNGLYLDSKPISPDYFTATLIDKNSNGVADLDGTLGTDVIELDLQTTGLDADYASVTIDLSKINAASSTQSWIAQPPGTDNRRYFDQFTLFKGTTDRQSVTFKATIRDRNGNITYAYVTPTFLVDNKPPTIDAGPTATVIAPDILIPGEANFGDKIRFQIDVSNNNGITPEIDFSTLIPSTSTPRVAIPLSAGNRYILDWTVQANITSYSARLPVYVYDSSLNTISTYTTQFNINSRVPTVVSPDSYYTHFDNTPAPFNVPPIINIGDQVFFQIKLYDSSGGITSPASVAVDVRAIATSPSIQDTLDDFGLDDGNPNTTWKYLASCTQSATFWTYRGDAPFLVGSAGISLAAASFPYKLVYTNAPGVSMASGYLHGSSADVPLDSLKPKILSAGMNIFQTNGDNASAAVANIGDILRFWVNMTDYTDPGTNNLILYAGHKNPVASQPIYNGLVTRVGVTDTYEAFVTVASNTTWNIDLEGASNSASLTYLFYMADTAYNIASSANLTTNVSTFTVDNTPPVATFVNYLQLVYSPTTAFPEPGPAYAGIANLGTGTASDGITILATASENISKAWVDWSPIQGSSTWPITFNGTKGASQRFLLATAGIALTDQQFTSTFYDSAGNMVTSYTTLTVNTIRPTLDSASYDGDKLRLVFSKPIHLARFGTDIENPLFDVSTLRIGNQSDLRVIGSSSVIKLTKDVDLVDTSANLTTVTITPSNETRSAIADWGEATLWMSIGYNDDNTVATVTRDLTGNFPLPISRYPSTLNVTHDTFALRPKLVNGLYNGADASSRTLILEFDRSVASSTITASSVAQLIIVKGPNDFYTLVPGRDMWASGEVALPPSKVAIQLATETMDWIALKFTYASTRMGIAIATPTAFPLTQPFIRDIKGNQVNTIAVNNALQIVLTPFIIPPPPYFTVATASLIVDDASSTLTLVTDKRTRVWLDESFSSQPPSQWPKTTPNCLPSKIYVYQNANKSGNSLALTRTVMADSSINSDYASTTIKFKPDLEELKTMLSWNTSKFYIVIDSGAVKDIWGNSSIPLDAVPTNPTVDNAIWFNTIWNVISTPKIVAFSVNKTSPMANPNATFNVEYETSMIFGGLVSVPIDRTSSPTLKFKEMTVDAVIATPTFVGWTTRDLDSGVRRYIAQFTGPLAFATVPALSYQSSLTAASQAALIGGIATDVFNNPAPSVISSYVYQISDMVSGDPVGWPGFQAASTPLTIDKVEPYLLDVIPPVASTLGVTPKLSAFVVYFNERMDTRSTPTLRMISTPNSLEPITFSAQTPLFWNGTNTEATFLNNQDIDFSTSPQGSYSYVVANAVDLAGNQISANGASHPINLKSQGPYMASINTYAWQSTIATAGSNPRSWPNRPFSTSATLTPGIATVTVQFASAPTSYIPYALLMQTGNPIPIAYATFTLAIFNPGPLVYDATFTGAIASEGTYEVRVYDASTTAGNEGNLRASLIIDQTPPTVFQWTLDHAKNRNGVVYFSPAIHSYMRVSTNDANAGEQLYLRVRRLNIGNATDTYPLNNAHYLDFNGVAIDTPTGFTSNYLVDTSNAAQGSSAFTIDLVDAAGNVSNSSTTFIMDRFAPQITSMAYYRSTDGRATNRFNPATASMNIALTIAGADGETSSGTAFVRIKSGGTIIRDDLPISSQSAGLATSTWDGRYSTASGGAIVPDGSYDIEVVDLAENKAATVGRVEVNTTIFKVTAASEVNKTSIQVTFSTDVATATANTGNSYLVAGRAGGTIPVSTVAVSGKVATLGLSAALTHDEYYTITASITSITTVDGDPLTAGNESVALQPAPAVAQGPTVTKEIDFTGVATAREFKVIFDQKLDTTSANTKSNYTVSLATSSTTLYPIVSAVLQSDGVTVKLTTATDLTADVAYVFFASDVMDLYQNKCTPAGTTKNFRGQDFTPPQFEIYVFSNPANEYDIAIVAKTNKDLKTAPTAIVTQSGGSVSNLPMNANGTRLYMAGTLLDKNYTGAASVQVNGTDLRGNNGTSNPVSFSIAYVNASIRAEIQSIDGKLRAVFNPKSLKTDTMVSILPVTLEKVINAQTKKTGIRAKIFSRVESASLKNIKTDLIDNVSSDELTPIGQAYALNIPAGRLAAPVNLTMALPDGKWTPGLALFHMDGNGSWKFVSRLNQNGHLLYASLRGGSFALLQDTQGPRASLLTKIDPQKPIRDARPTFEWSFAEEGSGLDIMSVKAVVDGKDEEPIIDEKTGKVVYKPFDPMVGGEHTLALKIADRSGNITLTPEIRFLVLPPLVIYEIAQFPNPARMRSTMRVGTNRPDITTDLMEVTIYDAAGHKVHNKDGLDFISRFDGSRRIHELNWDLTNDGGDQVANGVYFVKITVHDPDDTTRKTKVTQKIAVLR